MGSAAGKQSKIKKIYVKSKDADSDEDAVSDAIGALADPPSVPPMTYAEQLAAARAMANPEATISASSAVGADASPKPDQTILASSGVPGHRKSEEIYSSPELAMALPAFAATPAARLAAATTLPEMSPNDAQASKSATAFEDAKPIASCGPAAQSTDRGRQEREAAVHVEPQCLLALENHLSPRSFSSDEGSVAGSKPQVVSKMATAQIQGDSRERRAQSFSSDEGSVADSRPQALRETKFVFATVLRESHDRRAQERADWLKSLGEAAGNFSTDQLWGTTDKQGFGFNDTRRPAPVLRDPDIFEQVRKWNVKVHRDDEIPQAPPVRCYAKDHLF